MTETSSPQPSQTPENVVGNQEAAASSRPDVLLEQLLKPEVQESLTTRGQSSKTYGNADRHD